MKYQVIMFVKFKVYKENFVRFAFSALKLKPIRFQLLIKKGKID